MTSYEQYESDTGVKTDKIFTTKLNLNHKKCDV